MSLLWSDQHSILLAKEICGYEVQTSPRGVHYVIEDGRTRPLPDFPRDPGETLTTLEAWLHLNDVRYALFDQPHDYQVTLYEHGPESTGRGRTLSAAICWALIGVLTSAVAE